jgi:hypothetical protein
VHLQTCLVQSFILLFQNFEEVVQIITLKMFEGALHYNQLAPVLVLTTRRMLTARRDRLQLNTRDIGGV